MGRFETKYGTLYVPENHEYYWNIRSWLKVFSQMGFNILYNEGENILINNAPVFIAGVSDQAGSPGPDVAKSAAGTLNVEQRSSLRILLSH